ncbi:putative phage tail protein [Clostridium sp. Mt-5]|uniref:Phage tail protein n=1 Tax=Clostridium moutaii TaxID=3240932 RepID=A0ABV4BS69_9CLOT
MFKDDLINNLHKLYRQDPYINQIFNSAGLDLDNLATNVQDALNQYDFSTMTWGIPILENTLNFKTNSNSPIEDKRSQLQAKWRSNGKSDIYLLQAVANSWKNGDCTVTFVNGKIQVQFTGEYGTPTDLDSLKKALENVKPEHLAIVYSFRYLTIGEVQNMTLAQMEQTPLSKFAF